VSAHFCATKKERGTLMVEARRRRGKSLERRLPLLITALLLLVLGANLMLTSHELSRSGMVAAGLAMQRLERELVSNADNSPRRALVQQVASDSSVHRALAGRPVDSVALRTALARLIAPADSGLPIRLWPAGAAQPEPIGLNVASEAVPPELFPQRDDSSRSGPIYRAGARVVYWNVIPVSELGKRLGWIVQQRRIASPAATRAIRGITGREVTLYVHNRPGLEPLWATINGVVVPPPSHVEQRDSLLYYERDVNGRPTQMMAAESPVRATSLILVTELPTRSATAAARAATLRLGMVSLALLLAGAALAWVISLRLTRPLSELTSMTESMAAGDFSRRASSALVGAPDEVGRLAASFNHMAEEVSASRMQLERTNASLIESKREADESRDTAERARVEAETANKAKASFLATMSHELRTPLNAIAGYTQLLEMGIHGSVNAQQRDDLMRIQRSQRALLSMVEDVLSFARLEAGRMHYNFDAVLLDEAIAEAELLIAPQAQAKGIAYRFMPAANGAKVWADREKLAKIVTNLLSNAVKFTDPGGSIALESEARGGAVLVHVHDTGRGVPAEMLEAIFEPFAQGETGLTRTTGGTGLGLAISREFARAMGGELSVESTVGAGSRFTLRLPVHDPIAASQPRASRTTQLS
jgi:signal transduction histidine kinase